jgi:lysophospholipase L1-like esterase
VKYATTMTGRHYTQAERGTLGRVRRIVLIALGVLLAFGSAAVGLSAAAEPPVPTVAAAAVRPVQPAQPRPLLAVIGASFSAGVGAGSPGNAWPEVVARSLGWRLAVSADSGAGYVNPGLGDRGPFARLAADLDLRQLHPSVVIIQGGHDDIGEPPSLVSERVTRLIDLVRTASPESRVDLLTVFSIGDRPSPAAVATDTAIVTAARQADPGIVVFDPLTGHWRFPRIADHLHPSPAGHRWIADQLIPTLRRQVS